MESKDDIIAELRAHVEKQAQQIAPLTEEVGFPQHSRFRNQRTVINDHMLLTGGNRENRVLVEINSDRPNLRYLCFLMFNSPSIDLVE